MQVIMVSQLGGPEVLQVGEADLPRPRPGEVLVRVLAAGVGPWDASLRAGGWTGPLPYVPGGEFAGVVVGDTGADAALDDGAPVYGYPGLTGCYAQYVTCPVEKLAPIPAGLPITDAAAAPIDALTAEQGLTDELAIGAGDQVLITAGAGGVGHFAVQIARILGRIGGRHRQPAAPRVPAPARRCRGHRPHQARLARPGPRGDRRGRAAGPRLRGAHPGGRGPGGPRRGAHRHAGARRGARAGSTCAGAVTTGRRGDRG